MSKRFSEIKRNAEKKILKLRIKRGAVVNNLRKKIEEAKTEQIRNSIIKK